MTDYEEPFKRFEDISSTVRRELDAIVSMIDSGIAPQQEDAQLLQKDLAQLRTAYQDARSLTAPDGNPDGLMPDGLPIKSYQDEVCAQRKKLLEEKLVPIETILRRFCTITSDAPRFEEAFRPFREAAAESLESLERARRSNSLVLDIDDKTYRPQEAFIQALQVEDLSTDEGTQLLDEIEREFSARVMQGVCLNKYQFGNPIALEDDADTAKAPESIDEPLNSKAVEKATPPEKEAPVEHPASSDQAALAEQASSVEQPASSGQATLAEQVAPTEKAASTGQTVSRQHNGGESGDKTHLAAKKPQNRITKSILSKGKSRLAKTHNPSTRLIFAVLARLGCMSEKSLQTLVSLEANGNSVSASDRYGKAVSDLFSLRLAKRSTVVVTGPNSYSLKTYALSNEGKMLAEEAVRTGTASKGCNPTWPIDLADAQGRMLGCEEQDDRTLLWQQNDALVSVLAVAAADESRPRLSDLFRAFHWDGAHYVIDRLRESDGHYVPDCSEYSDEEAGCILNCMLATNASDVPEGADAVLLAGDLADEEIEKLDAKRTFLLRDGFIEELLHSPEKELQEEEDSWMEASSETETTADVSAEDAATERADAGALPEEQASKDTVQSEETPDDVPDEISSDKNPAPEEAAGQPEPPAALVELASPDEAEEEFADPIEAAGSEEEAQQENGAQISSVNLDGQEPQEEGEPDDEGAEETADAQSNSSSVKGIAEAILRGDQAFDDETAISLADDIMNEAPAADDTDRYSGIETALALLKCVSGREGFEQSTMRHLQLSLAVDSPLGHEDYTGAHLIEAFPDVSANNEGFMLAAYCHALCTPASSYDHDIRQLSQHCLDEYDDLFPTYPMVKALFVDLMHVNDVLPDGGFTSSILKEIGGDAERQQLLREISQDATRLCSIPRTPKFRAMKALAPFTKICFGQQSELYACMQVIAENRQENATAVERVFNKYFDGEKFDAEAIDRFINKAWAQSLNEVRGPRKLQFDARNSVKDEVTQRLAVMQRWLETLKPNTDANKVARIRNLKNSLVEQCDELLKTYALPNDGGGAAVQIAITEIRSLLSGTGEKILDFKDFLRSGYLPTGDDGLPVVEPKLCEINLCEPWRNVLRHIINKKPSLEEAAQLISDDTSRMFDNLNQLAAIGKILGADKIPLPDKSIEDAALAAANEELSRFNDKLEIAFTYNQIDEIQKESLEAYARDTETFFYGLQEYGCWREFLKNLYRQIDDFSEVHARTLAKRLESCRASIPGRKSNLLDEAERLLEDDKNFTVVEEYLNRFDAGEQQISEDQIARIGEPNEFAEFMSDRIYTPIFELCRRNSKVPLAKFAIGYLRTQYPTGWTEEQKNPTELMVKNWPNQTLQTGSNPASRIRGLMRGLGLTTLKQTDLARQRGPLFHFNTKPAPRDSKTYSHPIAAFGTQMKDKIDVLVLYGSHSPQSIIDAVSKSALSDYSIVLVDYAISISERRQVSEIYHKRQNLPTFLLVDRVLFLYLATKDPKSRLSIMLKCTLPFTRYQPFVRDGGATADEMFCGRESELNSITDMNGATVVYGGRQLGKTALLQRAQSLCNKPDIKQYAVYVSILQCDSEESLVSKLVGAVQLCSNAVTFQETNTLEDFCSQIKTMIGKGTISALYLFIDEVDRYLGSISSSGYRQLQPLVDLRRESNGKFKFVLAGLHNVSRAKNATANNGIFGQLGTPLCIKPLSPTDALQLISRPLSYLGFQVDRYPHLETILTTTNYYPGILQFFGYILVDTMSSQYAEYYRAQDDNPPYQLTKEQLGAIMSSTDLNNSIKEKFKLSLELDSRYFMIASCIALMYYEAEETMGITTISGYSPAEVKKTADDWGINKLKGETIQSYGNLMDEMVDMYILSKPDQDVQRYRLRRHAFLSIIGKNEEAVVDGISQNDDPGE